VVLPGVEPKTTAIAVGGLAALAGMLVWLWRRRKR